MASYADLELGLHPWEEGSYAVELRFSQPNSEAEIRLVQDGPVLVKFDRDGLRLLTTDAKEYGKRLYDSLFVPDVQRAFAQARNSAQEKEVPLRLRLFIASKARELHSLRWETLCDPADERFLLMNERVLFSRYVVSADWRPVRSRAQDELRTLIVIANPADLATYKPGGVSLAPLDVPAELAGARSGLGTMEIVHLSSERGAGGRATLENLFHCLRDGYDILYSDMRWRSRHSDRAWWKPESPPWWPCWGRLRCRPRNGSCPSFSGNCSVTDRSIGRWQSLMAQRAIGTTGGCPSYSCALRAAISGTSADSRAPGWTAKGPRSRNGRLSSPACTISAALRSWAQG